MEPKQDVHHRKPRSLGGDDSPRNLSYVSRTRHNAWHTLFANWSPTQIARHINAMWLDPDYRLVVVTAEEHSAVERFLKQKRGGRSEL
jgi:hypothetical protein